MSTLISDYVDTRLLDPTPAHSVTVGMSVSGIDVGYANQAAGLYELSQRAPGFATDEEVWAALGARNDVVVVQEHELERLLAESGVWTSVENEGSRENRLEDSETKLPVRIQLIWPGDDAFAPVDLQVIGTVNGHRMLADSDVLVNRNIFTSLTSRPLRPEAHYIKTRAGLDEEETRVVAQAAEKAVLSSGLNASLTSDRFAVAQVVLGGMLQLFQGFLSLGLITGLAGLAVIGVRTVVERRQQVGMLRAMGMSSASVALMFVLESSFVALSGIVVGTAVGMVTGHELIGTFYTFATDEPLGVPWSSVLGIAGGTYLFSVFVTTLPAWQASRIYPAEALRYE